jgi:2-octaprenylphenol hydroxylase
LSASAEIAGRYDLIIVGGGMVGAALGCAAAAQGLSLALVEGRPPQRTWPKAEVDLRVSALSRASQRILRRLGAWERMEGLGISPYREMRVWDAGGGGSIHFDSAEVGEPDLGHIVENRVTQLALWERLEAAEGVRLWCPARLGAVSLADDAVEVRLAGGEVLQGRLLVGADGRDSAVRAQAGIATRGWAYDQQAIVARVRPERWHAETAWQRFLPTGPLAFLPLADGCCSIVWSAEARRAQELMALDDAGFGRSLGEAFEHRLGDIVEVGRRAAIPLRLEQAERYVMPRLALIGDAAHAIHPLAGQGVNLGFLDAAALAGEIAAARARGRDIGSLGTLRRYERARWGENLAMLAAMDGFKRLFSNQLLPLEVGRNLGLEISDRLPGLKRLYIRRALGLSGELPPLARV